MFSNVRTRIALLVAATSTALTGCVAEAETALGSTDGPIASVVFEGVTYTPEEFAALGVSPARFVSTVESARDSVVYAFAAPAARDAFIASLPKLERPQSFNRNNSKFYEDTGYGNKLLELGVGESVPNLDQHPCNCGNKISSLKASQDANWTVLYDNYNLNDAGGSLYVQSGAEIVNLNVYKQPGGASWGDETSSLWVTN